MRGGFTVLVDEANLRDFALHPSKDAPLKSRTIEKTGCALCRHRGRMTTEQRSELKMVTKIELKNLRVTNLLSALLMNRAVDPNRFGSEDDLKEIGLLTMQFADLEESLAFAADGKVRATIETLPLESINDVFSRLKKGQINGRVVLSLKEEKFATAAMTRFAS